MGRGRAIRRADQAAILTYLSPLHCAVPGTTSHLETRDVARCHPVGMVDRSDLTNRLTSVYHASLDNLYVKAANGTSRSTSGSQRAG